MVELISALNELYANIARLEEIRLRAGGPDRAAYLGFVKRGTCFLPYRTADGTAFAPSRLLGYRDNNFARHAANDAKHGSLTNAAITEILGHEPSRNAPLEQAYHDFCTALGFTANEAGRFGHPRKYWNVLERATDLVRPRAVPTAVLFKVGQLYTRAQIADLIALSDRLRGGPWLTGYAKVAGAFYLFANVGSSGRTGHDYPNRWDGREFIWHGKSGTELGQTEIDTLLSGDLPVHIFWRSADRAAFTYAGLGVPVEAAGAKPVQVRWRFIAEPRADTPRDGLPVWRRGPPPSAGTRKVERLDKPTSVYLLVLEGPVAAVFPELAEDASIIKVGMSNDPDRRIDDLSCGFPPGCALYWRLVARRDFADGDLAFAVETAILERLRVDGAWIGGEFAAVRTKDLALLAKLRA